MTIELDSQSSVSNNAGFSKLYCALMLDYQAPLPYIHMHAQCWTHSILWCSQGLEEVTERHDRVEVSGWDQFSAVTTTKFKNLLHKTIKQLLKWLYRFLREDSAYNCCARMISEWVDGHDIHSQYTDTVGTTTS